MVGTSKCYNYTTERNFALNRTIEYLKNLREDVTHAIEQEDCSIQVNSNDLRHINEALEDIQNEQRKFTHLHDDLIELANNFRDGHVGEITDSFLVDEVITILKRY